MRPVTGPLTTQYAVPAWPETSSAAENWLNDLTVCCDTVGYRSLEYASKDDT
jgi:hypothetical protein